MNKVINTNIDQRIFEFEYTSVPDTCPICHEKIQVISLYAIAFTSTTFGELYSRVVFLCPNNECKELFIGKYSERRNLESHTKLFGLDSVTPRSFQAKEFNNDISVFYNFSEIYNQALCAEQLELNQISGVGYRKALEFLIKDYVISKTTEVAEQEAIKEKPLGKVINDHITDSNIKEMAKRAAWLGNDETHYLRKWIDKDIKDLKILIELVVFYIESDFLVSKYTTEMTN